MDIRLDKRVDLEAQPYVLTVVFTHDQSLEIGGLDDAIPGAAIRHFAHAINNSMAPDLRSPVVKHGRDEILRNFKAPEGSRWFEVAKG